jgi:hypothetical protein
VRAGGGFGFCRNGGGWFGFREQGIEIGKRADGCGFYEAQTGILGLLTDERRFEFADDFLETFNKGGRTGDS